MNLKEAQHYANTVLDLLSPFCERIEIAGSIRREKSSNIKDIEIVCIPTCRGVIRNPDFLRQLSTFIKNGRHIKGNIRNGSYVQIWLGKRFNYCKLDLFICDKYKWGMTMAIRTGPAEFSATLLSCFKKLGYKNEHSMPRNEDYKLGFLEEKNVFSFLGLDYIHPTNRDKARISFKLKEFSDSNIRFSEQLPLSNPQTSFF